MSTVLSLDIRFKWHNSCTTDRTQDHSRQPLCTPPLYQPRLSVPSKRNILEHFAVWKIFPVRMFAASLAETVSF